MPPDDTASPQRSRRLLGRGPGAAPSPAPPAAGQGTADPGSEFGHTTTAPEATVDAPPAPTTPLAEPEPEPAPADAEPVGVSPEGSLRSVTETPPGRPASADVVVPGPATPAPTPADADADTGPGDDRAAEDPAGPASGAAEDGPASAEDGAAGGDGRFTVRLANFEGPFDLLLQLISKHKLDVTEVALSEVTDEFMAHIRAMGPDWDLDQATEFLVVAATLLDLKAARLLPAAEVEDQEDLALLEARDLLFARLLQYRAYKRMAAIFAERLEAEALHHPRTVGLEPQHAELLPEVVLSIGPERFAQLAVKAMQPKPKPQVYVDHIHAPLVSVREQAEQVIAMLRERGEATFRELTLDAPDTLTVVARFLALLELYREKAVALDQEEALGTLQVRWTGGEAAPDQPLVTDEFDQEPAAGKDGKA